MSKTSLAAGWFSRLGGDVILHQVLDKKRLTVLNYHRIADVNAPDFVGFAPNVSTDAIGFEAQMRYVQQHFNVISVHQLVAHISDNEPLPDHPLLITFDDGYLDNYTIALPILRQFGFPAVIFLMTSRMTETHTLPWWDACSEIFRRTQATSADLPLLGQRDWVSQADREAIADQFIQALKKVPEAQKLDIIASTVAALNVDLSLKTPLFATWEQVRELVAHDIACQPHTHTHPILSRISSSEARKELELSKALIEQETAQKSVAFAYPNGTLDDYTEDNVNTLKDLGFHVAFTLENGPMTAKDVRQYPFQIRRIFLGYKDTLDIFKLKVMGVPALLNGKTTYYK